MNKTFYTYLHCKPDGTPFYVGKGCGTRGHRLITSGRNQFHRNIVQKYGKENIKIYIFPCTSELEALQHEIHQIKQLRAEGMTLANLCDGGEGLSNPSPEIRKRLSDSHKGIGHTTETRAKMSATRKGKEKPDWWKAKISAAHIGKIQGPMHENTRLAILASRVGIPLTEEHKAKTAAGMIGNKNALGNKHSAEARAKMSAAAKRRYAKNPDPLCPSP